MRPVLRFLRISNAPTVPADILAGCCAGPVILQAGGLAAASVPLASLLLACAAALAIYHGGMALNGIADLRLDRTLRPDRPLPSGELRLPHALAWLGALWVAALLCTLLLARHAQSAALMLAVLFLAALVYNLAASRSRWSGPAVLGLCRALDLGVGLALAGAMLPLQPRSLLLMGGYAIYVASLSALARMEDSRVHPGACRAALVLAAAAFLSPVFLVPDGWSAAPLSLLGAAVVLLEVRRSDEQWTRALVAVSVGRLLRLILIFDAAICLGSGHPLIALALCLAYPLVAWISRAIPPT